MDNLHPSVLAEVAQSKKELTVCFSLLFLLFCWVQIFSLLRRTLCCFVVVFWVGDGCRWRLQYREKRRDVVVVAAEGQASSSDDAPFRSTRNRTKIVSTGVQTEPSAIRVGHLYRKKIDLSVLLFVVVVVVASSSASGCLIS